MVDLHVHDVDSRTRPNKFGSFLFFKNCHTGSSYECTCIGIYHGNTDHLAMSVISKIHGCFCRLNSGILKKSQTY